MPHNHGWSHPEKRNTALTGIARRARFEASLNLLRSLELSPFSIEHYLQLAREKQRLPHELVREATEQAALRSVKIVRYR